MTLSEFIVTIMIAALVGIVGEALARRHAPMGCLGATILGFIAIALVNNVLKLHILGEPSIDGVPLITSIIAAAILVAIWSAFAYRRVYAYSSRRYRRTRSWW
jgi:uncharacterized membrane protein YeaQ/YmgE (transglycosylase-associated protein family)